MLCQAIASWTVYSSRGQFAQLCNHETDLLENAADRMERWLDSYIGTAQGCTVSMSKRAESMARSWMGKDETVSSGTIRS